MFENITKFFKKFNKKSENKIVGNNSKNAAKERLHLVLMQDRANVSADFLELMKQEIIDVIKKYIDVDESAIDVRLTNKENEDGTNGAPALYANIPIVNIKNDARKTENKDKDKKEENKLEPEDKQNESRKEEKETQNNEDDKIIKQEELDEEKNKKDEEKEVDEKEKENSETEEVNTEVEETEYKGTTAGKHAKEEIKESIKIETNEE